MGPRTLVIGAGVLGLAVAERLAATGAAVTLLDRGEPGTGTSGTTFSWLNGNAKVPRTYQQLNVAGVEAYRRLAADDPKGTAPWLRLNGRIEWAETPEQIERMERAHAAMRAWDYPVEEITLADAARLEPDLRIPPGSEARLFPSEGFLIPPLFLPWLLARVETRGVELRRGSAVTGLVAGDDRAIRRVDLEDGSRLQADRVVLCVGRWTEAVAALAGVRIPMIATVRGTPSPGYLGYTSPVSLRLSRTVTGPGLSVRADAPPGRYVLQPHGLDLEADPLAVPPPDGSVGHEILRRARRVLVGLDDARLIELRVGQRAIPVDRVTVAGWAPGVEGLYVLATHSGYSLALHLGELVSREVAESTDEPTLGDFRPSRFAAAVEEAAVAARPVH